MRSRAILGSTNGVQGDSGSPWTPLVEPGDPPIAPDLGEFLWVSYTILEIMAKKPGLGFHKWGPGLF